MNDLSSLLKNIQTGEFGLSEFFISIVVSLALGVICMFLYDVYFGPRQERNESLSRSFLIIAPSVSAIFWAIQYSLPLSLGLLGALSFVRFRTPVKRPEDIAFILLVIALSLLSSVFRFFAAGILVAVIGGVVVLKSFISGKGRPILGGGKCLTAFVSTASLRAVDADAAIRKALQHDLSALRGTVLLDDIVQKDSGYNLRYSFYLKRYDDTVLPKIFETLSKLDGTERVEVFHGKFES